MKTGGSGWVQGRVYPPSRRRRTKHESPDASGNGRTIERKERIYEAHGQGFYVSTGGHIRGESTGEGSPRIRFSKVVLAMTTERPLISKNIQITEFCAK